VPPAPRPASVRPVTQTDTTTSGEDTETEQVPVADE